jgi:hypothetical protein
MWLRCSRSTQSLASTAFETNADGAKMVAGRVNTKPAEAIPCDR